MHLTRPPRLRWIGRYDAPARMLRLARLTWTRGTVGDGQGYSSKLTLALWPRLFHVAREFQSWAVTLLGLRVHLVRSYGGIFAD